MNFRRIIFLCVCSFVSLWAGAQDVIVDTLVASAKVEFLTRATLHGDTLTYNAAAYRVSDDAEIGTLLRKMPGVQITDGKLEAHGEQVKKVYLDGKEYFGGNLEMLFYSLPANAIESVEFFNTFSEESENIGIDDGNGSKAINIKTKKKFFDKAFGKANAGGGLSTNERNVETPGALAPAFRYSAGGYLNYFQKERRVSVLALANNVNKQNFSDDQGIDGGTDGSFTVGRRPGVATAQMFGLSYLDNFGPTDKKGKKPWKMESMVYYNHSAVDNRSFTERIYNEPAKLDTIVYDGYSRPLSHILRTRVRLDYKKGNHSLMILPVFYMALVDKPSGNTIDTYRHGESGPRYIPSDVRLWSNRYKGDFDIRYGYNITKKTYFQLYGHWGIDYTANNKNTSSGSGASPETVKYSYSFNKYRSMFQSANLNPSISYRIDKNHRINFSHKFRFQPRSRDNYIYTTGSDFVVTDPTLFRPSSSYDKSGFIIDNITTVGYRYSHKKGWLSLQAGYRRIDLTLKDELHPDASMRRGYNFPDYAATFQWNAASSRSIKVTLKTTVNSPSIWQLSDLYDVSNTTYISRGNSALRPEQKHELIARYSRVLADKGVTYMFVAQGSVYQDFIARTLNLDTEAIVIDGKTYHPIQIQGYENLRGSWKASLKGTVGFPLQFMRCNMNVALTGDYASRPAIVNDEYSKLDSYAATLNLVLGSNISKYVDFTLAWIGSYVYDKSYIERLNNNYFRHRATAAVNLLAPWGTTFSVNCAYTQFLCLRPHLNVGSTVLNATLGQKFLKGKAEIQLCAYDILNQANAFSRAVQVGYSQYNYNSTLGRYFLLKFIYKFGA